MANLDERAAILRLRLKQAGRREEAAQWQVMAEADIDTELVRRYFEAYLASIDHGGLRLIADLEADGRVAFIEDPWPEMTEFGSRYDFEKGQVVPAVAHNYLQPHVDLLAEAEDLALLKPLGRAGCKEVGSSGQVPTAIDRAVDQLASRGLPASHIVLPWEWRALEWLADGGQVTVASRLQLGTYRGATVYRAPLPWPATLVMVFALSRWLRLRVARPGGQVHVHPRFQTVIRPPNDDERRRWMERGIMFRDGSALTAGTLEHAIATKWRAEVYERWLADEDPNAMLCFVYQPTDDDEKTTK